MKMLQNTAMAGINGNETLSFNWTKINFLCNNRKLSLNSNISKNQTFRKESYAASFFLAFIVKLMVKKQRYETHD